MACPTSASSSVCYYSHTGPTKFSMLLDMVKSLQADIKKVNTGQSCQVSTPYLLGMQV